MNVFNNKIVLENKYLYLVINNVLIKLILYGKVMIVSNMVLSILV